MEYLHKLIGFIRDPGPLIDWVGYPGLAVIIFLETGALVFFLPGDSLLVTAGLYAAAGKLTPGGPMAVVYLNLLLIPMAVLGDAVSYLIGARMGPALFKRPESRYFKPQHLQRAHAFYEKHGGKAIIIARFMPVVRTFVPVVAGAAKMPYRRFAAFNVIGGASWILSMTLIGFLLGQVVPNIGQHIEKVIVVVVLISLSPGIVEYVRGRLNARKQAAGVK
ncbi:MAG: VTT domain-containing protein [Myxococcaceae bacterium]|nr:VTT domain-containing protein [Myxococcaceae bacterium]